MNNIEAFQQAVHLMQTAPTKEHHARAKALVVVIAAELSDAEFEQAMGKVI